MPLRLSVVVVTYNSANHIVRCLRSVMKRRVPEIIIEVVIIDNHSSDDTLATIKSTFPEITLIQNDGNSGFAKAVNKASTQCAGDYILILNPDAVLDDDFLTHTAAIIEKSGNAAVIGSRIVDFSGNQCASCWKDPSVTTLLAEMFLPYAIARPLITELPNNLSRVDNVPGTALLVRADAFRKVSGFDQRFFLYYEDFDLCRRVRNAGEEVWYSPELVVAHQQKAAGLIDWDAFLLNVTNGRLKYYEKYYSSTGYLLVRGIIIVGSMIRVMAYSIASIFMKDPNIIVYKKAHIALLGRIRSGMTSIVASIP